jgi:hypothetical protein
MPCARAASRTIAAVLVASKPCSAMRSAADLVVPCHKIRPVNLHILRVETPAPGPTIFSDLKFDEKMHRAIPETGVSPGSSRRAIYYPRQMSKFCGVIVGEEGTLPGEPADPWSVSRPRGCWCPRWAVRHTQVVPVTTGSSFWRAVDTSALSWWLWLESRGSGLRIAVGSARWQLWPGPAAR